MPSPFISTFEESINEIDKQRSGAGYFTASSPCRIRNEKGCKSLVFGMSPERPGNFPDGDLRSMACDLHLHSTASDGGFTPKQVVEHAFEIALSAIALTDHDTVEGIPEAQTRALELGLPFIPGIEMTSVDRNNEIHILGYFLNPEDEKLKETLQTSKHLTLKRLTSITKLLTELGYPLTMEEVREMGKGESLGRPHIAQAMVRRGYVENTQEAFERFIGSYGPAYAQPSGILPQEAYQLILHAGGIPAIAHPGQGGRADMMQDNDIATHREWGALAIEVFHPRHDQYMMNYYLKLAQKFGMGIVGGSDCHGSYYPIVLMDRKAVPDWVAEKFFEFHEQTSRKSGLTANQTGKKGTLQ